MLDVNADSTEIQIEMLFKFSPCFYYHNTAMSVPATELSPADAAREAPATCARLRAIAAAAAPVDPARACVRVAKAFDAGARTYTFHTHVFVPGASSPTILARVSELFFRAYELERHGWYSQFVEGKREEPPPGLSGEEGLEHALGWGVFDLGLCSLRAYHTLFSRHAGADGSVAIALRTVAAAAPPPRPSTRVFLLPPTGDLFRAADGGLHWHHVCTVAGVRLLPGGADRVFMNALRASGLDSAERGTYAREGAAFVAYVTSLIGKEAGAPAPAKP